MRWLPLMLVLGCGEGLVGEAWHGDPAITFTGQISRVRGALESDLRVGLFWSPHGDTRITSDLHAHPAISFAVRYPARFEIRIFAPPKSVAWQHPGPVRVGLVLLWVDADGDGRLDVTEVRGGARNTAVLYAEDDTPAQRSPTGRALEEGFSIRPLPLRCEPAEDEPSEPSPGRPGAACALPTDCGSGDWICLTEDDDTFWPDGYCARPMSAGQSEPQGAEAGPVWRNEVLETLWLQGCNQASECRAGYVCQAETCRPDQPHTLVILRDFQIAPLCPPEDDRGAEDD